MNLSELDKIYIWHPYTQMKNAAPVIPIVKGDGVYLIDESGNKYIDAISSWWVNTHGHANPYIAKKIYEQYLALEHVIFAGFTHPVAIELAERILKHLPNNQNKVFYSDNGSTAVEVALKMAIQYWNNKGIKKTKIIALENAYHGDTFGAMSVSGRSVFTKAFSDLLFEVEFITVPTSGFEEKSLSELEKSLKNNDVIAFIFEPLVQGSAGMIMYDEVVLDKMLGLCKKYNVFTIADEVMTGFYRTGKFFATQDLQNKPDMYCLSKGITGGSMALGVTTCTNDIFEAFLSDDKTKTLYHGHSYTANPIACAAACASMDLYEEENFENKVNAIVQQHQNFAKRLERFNSICSVRQTGTIIAIELKTDNGANYLSNIREKIYTFFIDKRIILRPLGNVIYILPPYCISEDDLNYIYQSIEDFLTKELK